MKVKIVNACEIGGSAVEPGSIIELEDAAAQALIATGAAIEVTEASADTETQAAVAEAMAEEKACGDKVTTKEVKGFTMNLFTKAVKDVMVTKAATDYAGTEATEVLGQISRTASLFAKTRKMPITGNLKIVYCESNKDSGQHPTVGKVNASTTAATEISVAEYDAIPVKWFATIPVPSEMAEDVPTLEAYLGDELRNQLAIQLDGDILAGAFSSNYGCKGITTDANAAEATFADLDAPTKAELLAMVGKVDPGVRANATWAIQSSTWSAIVSELLDADNVGNQLITVGQNPTLFGFPVVETLSAPAAHPIVFGDFSRYFIGLRRDVRIEVDRSTNFPTDEAVIKISGRYAGGLAASIKQFGGVEYASMVYASETGAS